MNEPDAPAPLAPARPRAVPGVRRLAGALIATVAAALLLHDVAAAVRASPLLRDAFAAGLAAALATALGALPAAGSHRLGAAMRDALSGFGGGIMLAASAFSLLIPALAGARALGHGPAASALIAALGMAAGASLLLAIGRAHGHGCGASTSEDPRAQVIRRAWLAVLAIVLHNVPEGVAIGVAFAGSDAARATALATGIAIQDMPEGFIVATALIAAGYRRRTAVGIGMLSGLVEPVGALLGASVMQVSAQCLPWGLSFAAGAMLLVVVHDVIPGAQANGHRAHGTAGLLLGFIVMMALDTALG